MIQYRTYRIKQDGIAVAEASGPESLAKDAIMRYACQYEQDGPIEIQEKVSKRWKTIYKTPQERP